ncbi:MAG TPA: TRAP transporter small permease [Woeseiaceae bacterium]|nr:TRAP transporter small permease [Woeseiaceae bacterium]
MPNLITQLHRLTLGLSLVLVLVIIASLSVQIVSRYVFNAPVHMTDDIAEISLIWLTFLCASAVYRERGHIGIEIFSSEDSSTALRVLRIALHAVVIAVLSYVLLQVKALEPLMSRLEFGTVPNGPLTSKFVLILLPFAIGAALTILYAVEAIWLEIRSSQKEPQEPRP